jgi:hypothetical protein
MPKIFLSVIFLSCILSAYSQNTPDERVLIRGLIKDSTQNPVSYAHILNKNRNEGWVSDYYGTFRANALPGDTLVVSAVSFHKAIIVIPEVMSGPEYLAEIILQKEIVQLEEVVVHPWPATLELLKKEFMEVEIEDPLANFDLHLPSPKEMVNLAYPAGGFRIEGPVSALYNQFSKEAKSKRIYAELMLKEKAGKRYNYDVVTKITGLKSEDEIKKFMEFCALQIKFILDSSDYELYAAILGCYNDYCSKGYGPDTQNE